MPPVRGTCTMAGCDRPHRGHGFCGVHYYRWLRTGDPLCVRKPPGLPKRTEFCTVPGCGKPHSMHGLCRAHARRKRIYGSPSFVPTTRKPRTLRPVDERFWEKVDKHGPDECWPWKGTLNKDGYGYFKIAGQNESAQRVAFNLTYGPMPKGKSACHTCDNRYPKGDTTYRRCVNPGHVFPGSQSDNVKDMIRKRRSATRPVGSSHPYAKLTEAQVLTIRAAHVNGATHTVQAATYGVTATLIRYIVQRKIWRHI